MLTGVQEWADVSINIQRGCEHNCRYCWSRHMAVKRFHYCQARHWPLPCINEKAVDRPRGYHGTVMFPSTHDITETNLSQYLCVLRKLLDAGNKVLIVSKPHLKCIRIICKFYDTYRDRIEFRFTIGSTDDDVLKFWEPGAPGFDERFASLVFAYKSGFDTSVSCEPYLDERIGDILAACQEYISEFWIGRMRNFESRVDVSDVSNEDMEKYVKKLQVLCCDGFVRRIYESFKDNPIVRWKDSIRKVVRIE